MGFYASAQIVRDAREHGVEMREVDINFSEWDATLERSYARLLSPLRGGVGGGAIGYALPLTPPPNPPPQGGEGPCALHPRHAEQAPAIRTRSPCVSASAR